MGHIDMSALQNLDDGAVRLEFRMKDASYRQIEEDGSETFFYVDAPWASVPLIVAGMVCPDPTCTEHKLGQSDDCDTCEAWPACGHTFTVCPDCIESWSEDYYFRLALMQNGEISEWFTLNDAPGYKPL